LSIYDGNGGAVNALFLAFLSFMALLMLQLMICCGLFIKLAEELPFQDQFLLLRSSTRDSPPSLEGVWN